MEDLVRMQKKDAIGRASAEVGVVRSVSPHLVFAINGQEYSSEFFTVYVPAVDRIKQCETISTNEHTEAYVDIGDLELEPDLYERKFLPGDLIDVTDRGNSFIVHGRLVPWGEGQVLYSPDHR